MSITKLPYAILGMLLVIVGYRPNAIAQQILFVNDNDYIGYNTDTLLNDLQHTTFSSIHHWNIADSAGATPTALFMDGFDLVIWYSSTDGVGLKFWTAGSAAGNPELVSYTAGGGKLWVIGQDLLYAKHTTGTTFNSGDFAYDFMGLTSYDVQSYADDGSIGCPQADRSPGAPALFPASLKWIFSTLWYADGCTPQTTTNELYRMGPASYTLNGRKCMFHNNHGGVNVLSTFFDPALIDTFVNRVDFMQQGITYLLGTAGIAQPNGTSGTKIHPNPTTGEAYIDLNLPERTTVHLSITDMLGRVHYTAQEIRGAGQTTLVLPVQNLPSGMYMAQLWNEKGHYLYTGNIQKL